MKKPLLLKTYITALALASSLWCASAVAQTTYNWNSTSGGTWDQIDAAGWNTSVGDYPDGIDDTANFTQNITAGTGISINVSNAVIGTLNLDDTGGGAESVWTISTTDAVNNKLTFDVSAGNATLTSAGATNVISAPIVLNDNLDIIATNGLTLSGAISGSGGISKTGAGTVTLSSANTFAGSLTVNGGTLAISASGGYSGAGPVTIRSGTLSLTNSTAVSGTSSLLLGDTTGNANATFTSNAGIASTYTITVQSGNTGTATIGMTANATNAASIVLGTAGGAGHNVIFSSTVAGGGFTGVISDPAGLSGPAGVVTISGSGLTRWGNTASSYTGGTVLNSGNLNLATTSTAVTGSIFGTGTLTINGGAFQSSGSGTITVTGLSKLILNSTFTTTGSSTGSINISAPVDLGATGTATTRTFNLNSTFASQVVTLNGIISDGSNGFTTGITKTGARTLVLGGANDYTGATIIDQGILRIGTADNRLPTGTVLTINGGASSGGTFDLNGLNQTVAGLSAGSGAVQGIVTNGAAGASTSTLTVTGSSTFDGIIRDGSATAKVALTKSTGGTLELKGANTYTGATTINGGVLRIAAGGSLAAGSAVTVNNGGTLSGSGTVNGTVTVKNGGMVSPGNSPGTLTTGNMTFESGGIYKLELRNDGTGGAGSAGTEWDRLAISGTLDLLGLTAGNPFVLQLQTLTALDADGALASWDPNSDHTWASFVTTTGGFLGTFDSDLFSVDTSGFMNITNGTFSVVQNGNNLDLQYLAIPEPSAFVTLLAGLGLLVSFRRVRRNLP